MFSVFFFSFLCLDWIFFVVLQYILNLCSHPAYASVFDVVAMSETTGAELSGLAVSSAFPGWSIVAASGLVVSFKFINRQVRVAFCHHVDSMLLAILMVFLEKCCKSHRGVCFIQGNVLAVVVVGCHQHEERNTIARHAVVNVMLQSSCLVVEVIRIYAV